MYLIIQEGTEMSVFRTTLAAGLIFLATAPAHGMWQSIKDTVAPQQGLTINTQRIIAATAAISLIDVASTQFIDWSTIIANSSNPTLLRAAFLMNAVAVPVLFWKSLQNNPDFWNREGVSNRLFLAFSSLFSLNAIRIGLTAANIMQ